MRQLRSARGFVLGSVLVVYRREVLRLLRLDRPARGYVLALAVGTVPAVLVGLFLKDTVEAASLASELARRKKIHDTLKRRLSLVSW